jgi:hypothetical protein
MNVTRSIFNAIVLEGSSSSYDRRVLRAEEGTGPYSCLVSLPSLSFTFLLFTAPVLALVLEDERPPLLPLRPPMERIQDAVLVFALVLL